MQLRQNGHSIKSIAKNLTVAPSTLAGWLKNVAISPQGIQKLQTQQTIALQNARLKASDWHRTQKALRLQAAKNEAQKTLAELTFSPALLDLAFAMLYFGEGTNTDNNTVIASSNSTILRFVLVALKQNYGITSSQLRCDLHLRMDQDINKTKEYWSQQLNIPLDRFKSVSLDKSSTGKATYDSYKGVCVITCGNVAIQRKLTYLYALFCEKIIAELGD